MAPKPSTTENTDKPKPCTTCDGDGEVLTRVVAGRRKSECREVGQQCGLCPSCFGSCIES